MNAFHVPPPQPQAEFPIVTTFGHMAGSLWPPDHKKCGILHRRSHLYTCSRLSRVTYVCPTDEQQFEPLFDQVIDLTSK